MSLVLQKSSFSRTQYHNAYIMSLSEINVLEESFEYQGIQLYWDKISRVETTSDRPKTSPLIILHGWGASKKVMRPLAQMLGHHRDCYVLDLAGFGKSEEPQTAWSVDDYADSVVAWVHHLELSECDLIAHSYGGRISLKLLSRSWGSRIQKVIITGGAGMKPKRSPRYYYRRYLAKTLKAPFALLPEPLKTKGLERLRSTELWKSLGSSDYSVLSGVMRETFVRSVSEYLEYTLPKITHDVLLIWGEEDEATPVYQGKRIEQGITGAALVIMDGCGHYAFLDKPKQFLAIAEAYLKP